jgi:hypothetical protein
VELHLLAPLRLHGMVVRHKGKFTFFARAKLVNCSSIKMLHVKQGGLGRVEDGCAVAQAVSRRPLTAEARFGAGQSAWDLWWTKYRVFHSLLAPKFFL